MIFERSLDPATGAVVIQMDEAVQRTRRAGQAASVGTVDSRAATSA